jgi:hypothetical protein
MDAERSGRPGEYPRTDSELHKTHSGRPGPRCERRSCDRSCVRSLAWVVRVSDIGFPIGGSALPGAGRDPTEFAAFRPWGPPGVLRLVASAELTHRVELVLRYPPLAELSGEQRLEFDEALLDADRFEDLPGKWQAAILKAEQSLAGYR